MPTDEEKALYGLMAVVEEAAKTSQEIQRRAAQSLADLPESITKETAAKVNSVAEDALSRIEKAVESLQGIENRAKAINSSWRRTGGVVALIALCLGLIVGVAVWLYTETTLNREREIWAAELNAHKAAVAKEKAKLDELRSKTWGVELMTPKNEARYIILPKGMKVDTSKKTRDGRIAIILLN